MNVDQLKDSLRELAESTSDGSEKAAVMVFANKAWLLVSAGLAAARADEREKIEKALEAHRGKILTTADTTFRAGVDTGLALTPYRAAHYAALVRGLGEKENG